MSDIRPGPDTRRTLKREAMWAGRGLEVFDTTKKTTTVGYVRLPRLAPMAAILINNLSGRVSAGSLYLSIYAHDFGQGFVEVKDYRYILSQAGYTGKARSRRNWTERIKILKDLRFIETKSTTIEEDAFILLRDPHLVVAELRLLGRVDDDFWGVFCDRAAEIGVKMDSHMERAKETVGLQSNGTLPPMISGEVSS